MKAEGKHHAGRRGGIKPRMKVKRMIEHAYAESREPKGKPRTSMQG
jgi:hypothetical protein